MAERLTYGQKCKDCGHIDFVEDGAAGDVTCQVLSGNNRAGMRQACGSVTMHIVRYNRAEASKCSLCRCAAWLQSHTSLI